MRRGWLLLVAMAFLLGADAPGGCRAPWNPPPPFVPEPAEHPPHPDLLKKHAGRPLEYWIGLLETGESRERKDAAYKLGQSGDKGWVAIPALIRSLNEDDDFGVRSLSAQALGKLGPVLREVIPALEHAFKEDPHVSVRSAASKALARHGIVPESD